MARHRFFVTGALGAAPGQRASVRLDPRDLHHAARVLRLRPGEEIELVDPSSEVVIARVETATSAELHVVALERRAPAPSACQLVLVQGVCKGEKMDTIVRQAVELGADAIVPVVFERTVVRLDPRKRAARAERWQAIAKAAAEQAHRSSIPSVSQPIAASSLEPIIKSFDRALVLWEDAGEDAVGIRTALAGLRTPRDRGATPSVGLVVGPEGGLARNEVDALVAAGALIVTLGERPLRSETAAVVALALALDAMGGLGCS